MMLFLKKQAFQTIKMSFRHSRKNWHFSKEVNPRFSSKFENFFRVGFSLKRAQICIFMMLFIKKKAFQTIKMSFVHSRKNYIYPPGLNLRFWSIRTFFRGSTMVGCQGFFFRNFLNSIYGSQRSSSLPTCLPAISTLLGFRFEGIFRRFDEQFFFQSTKFSPSDLHYDKIA